MFPPSVFMQSLHSIFYSFINEEENWNSYSLFNMSLLVRATLKLEPRVCSLTLVWYVIPRQLESLYYNITIRSSYFSALSAKGFCFLKAGRDSWGVKIVGFVLSL